MARLSCCLRLNKTRGFRFQIGADLFCCTPTSWLPARSPRTASIVSCATCPVSHFFRCQVAQPMFRFTIHILHQGFTHCRGRTNLCTRILFADWRPLHCWSPEDTSDWSSADPYSRASTSLKKLITRLYFLKGTLQRTFGQKLSYITIREEYPIGFTPRGRRPTSSGTLHYRPVPSLSRILCLQCTIASSTSTVHSGHMSNEWGGLFICLLFAVYLLNI